MLPSSTAENSRDILQINEIHPIIIRFWGVSCATYFSRECFNPHRVSNEIRFVLYCKLCSFYIEIQGNCQEGSAIEY